MAPRLIAARGDCCASPDNLGGMGNADYNGPRDLDWFVPFALITALELILARSGDLVSVYSVFAFTGALAVFILATLWKVARMAMAGEQHPIARLKNDIDPARMLFAVAGIGMASLSFSAFTILKARMHLVMPFWADGPLAQFDHMLLGQDAWAAFNAWFGWALGPISLVYGFWILIQLTAFTAVLMTAPSNWKTQAIVSYALMWLVFGLGVACLLSSAGPIFFDQLYGGSRFEGLKPVLARSMVEYHTAEMLWRSHETGEIVFGTGISAMPSMHVAAAAWIALILRRTRFVWLGVLYLLVIYLGSVMLGWHYLTDGPVGIAGAWLCYALTGLAVNRRASQDGRRAQTGAAAAEASH